MARADEAEVDAALEAEPSAESAQKPLAVVRGLTPFGRTLATSGALLLVLGLAFGNYPYLLCAFLLLGVAFGAKALPEPRLSVARAISAADIRTGEALDVIVEVRNDDGDAAGVTIHDPVPDPFLLDGGSNFEAAWLERDAILDYRLRPPRRGAQTFAPTRVTVHDPMFVQSARVVDAGEEDEVVVHPQAPAAPRVRAPSAWGRSHVPGGDRALRGVKTNDFRELRPYQRGDPLKAVNWKATARASRGELNLIVNEYEVEGKKAIWVFIDASDYTVGGTNLENKFDELAHGALAVAAHYLDLGHRVGATVFGNGPTRILYPDVGDLQERRLQAALGSVAPGTAPGEGIAKAVEAAKGFLAREKPLIFVFTLAGRDADLPRALVNARALASSGRRPAPVVAVAPMTPLDGSPSARLVALSEKAQARGLERRGVSVVRYDPEQTPLQALLAKGVIR